MNDFYDESKLKEDLNDPIVNMIYLSLIAKNNPNGIGKKIIQCALDHGMPFSQLGGFINDLISMVREYSNDPEKALIDSLSRKNNQNDIGR